MKRYACKFCKKWTTRKEARECIMTHIKCDKGTRENKRKNSNVTEFMLREEVENV